MHLEFFISLCIKCHGPCVCCPLAVYLLLLIIVSFMDGTLHVSVMCTRNTSKLEKFAKKVVRVLIREKVKKVLVLDL